MMNYTSHLLTRGKNNYSLGKMSSMIKTENKCVLYYIETGEKNFMNAKATEITTCTRAGKKPSDDRPTGNKEMQPLM
jgi:hypothetical protein